MFLTRRRKKAMIEAKIIKIILLIFSFILIFGFIYKFYANITEHAGEQACRNSIILTQTLAEKVTAAGMDVGELTKPWPANCKTEDKISKTDDPEKVKKELAEMMSWCWWMMGEGVLKPFDKDYFYAERKCFVCYTIQFPNFEETLTPNDLMFYLKNKGKKGETYYDYLRYENNPVMQSAFSDPIDNHRIYGVIYMSPADPAWGNIMACLAVYTGAGAAIGAWGAGVGAIPGALVGGIIGGIRCGITAVAMAVEAAKEDVVYVTDINRGMGGCQGNWAFETQVKSA